MEIDNYPEGFLKQVECMLDSVSAADFRKAMSLPPVTGVRYNRCKHPASQPAWMNDAEPVSWCPSGHYVNQRPQFTLSPLWHQGCFYVQDPSSMIYETIVARLAGGSSRPLAFLDMCAAPGGKTTAAMNSLPQGSLVVANEFVGRRATILKENLIKYGWGELIVCNSPTGRVAASGLGFDIVAVDAPCSGEGMMRKDEEARAQWSQGLIRQCAALQREILADAWEALRPGGYLIYSTCTYNRVENEGNLDWLIEETGAEPIDLELPAEWGIMGGIDTAYPCLRFMPHVTRGEGLFVAVVRKKSGIGMRDMDSGHTGKNSRGARGKNIELPSWVRKAGGWTILDNDASICLFPEYWEPYLDRLRKTSKVIYAGVECAVRKGRDLAPAHPVAMSALIDPQGINCVEMDEAGALEFLRRNALPPFAPEIPKGYVLLLYGGLPLGFVKNLGNRSNNLYPAEWRIRSL